MQESTVFIVDDDDAVRSGLELLLQAEGYRTRSFASAREFLACCTADSPGCLILDLQMPEMSGLDLQRTLSDRGIYLPILFLSGHGSVPTAVQAIRFGAIDFLEKPFDSDILIDRVRAALQADSEQRKALTFVSDFQERVARLTSREREIMDMVVAGKASKVIAADLGISERTVEIHRARILQKMDVRNAAELVRLVLSAESRSS